MHRLEHAQVYLWLAVWDLGTRTCMGTAFTPRARDSSHIWIRSRFNWALHHWHSITASWVHFAIIQTSASSHLPMPSSGVQEPSFAHGSFLKNQSFLLFSWNWRRAGRSLSLLGPLPLCQLLKPLTPQGAGNRGGLIFSQGQETLSELYLGFIYALCAYCFLDAKFLA